MDNTQTLIALATTLLGITNFIFPKKIANLIGLSIENISGYIQIKAVFGGVLIALGTATLLFNNNTAYTMLGIFYLGLGLGRLIPLIRSRHNPEINNSFFFLFIELIVAALPLLK